MCTQCTIEIICSLSKMSYKNHAINLHGVHYKTNNTRRRLLFLDTKRARERVPAACLANVCQHKRDDIMSDLRMACMLAETVLSAPPVCAIVCLRERFFASLCKVCFPRGRWRVWAQRRSWRRKCLVTQKWVSGNQVTTANGNKYIVTNLEDYHIIS